MSVSQVGVRAPLRRVSQSAHVQTGLRIHWKKNSKRGARFFLFFYIRNCRKRGSCLFNAHHCCADHSASAGHNAREVHATLRGPQICRKKSGMNSKPHEAVHEECKTTKGSYLLCSTALINHEIEVIH